MKIIIATPLFPPEIENIATYTKELAACLKAKHQLQVLAYAGQVEEISGWEIFTINKRQAIFFRIGNYFVKLLKLAKQADIIFVQNSLATSLPAIMVKIITGKKVIINFIEDEAWKRARHSQVTQKSWQNFLEKPETNFKIKMILFLQAWLLRRADKVIVSSQVLAQAVSKSYNLPMAKLAVNYPMAGRPVILPFEQGTEKNQILVFGQDFDLDSRQWPQDWKVIVLGDKVLSKAEISYLINTSELIVYCAQSENFANFLIDCVVAGKNILVNSTAYAREIIGQEGVFADFGNQQEVAEKIGRLLGDRTENKYDVDRFSLKNHLDKLGEIFEASVKK